MMASSNGNIFRVTSPLWRECTGHRWIPVTKANDADLWCFLWSAPEQTVEQTIETLVIWDVIRPHCNMKMDHPRQQTSLAPRWPNVDPVGYTLGQRGLNVLCYLVWEGVSWWNKCRDFITGCFIVSCWLQHMIGCMFVLVVPTPYCDFTWMSWRLNSPAKRQFIEQVFKASTKIRQQSALQALCDQWIPQAKGQ